MCDTFLALPTFTGKDEVVFGKNSDREPNEAQAIIRFPALDTDEATVACTFIQIPQVKQTYEILVSKPYQMWGAEMGVNEHGVVIGNEAVFTNVPFEKKNNGLTGMDLVRLALERSRDADSALQTITDLLQTYGQDACGGYRDADFFYHNSFIIGDYEKGWVLETAGKHWAAKKIDGFAAISNGLTIEEQFDLHSPGLFEYAQQHQLVKKGKPFSFKMAFSDSVYTYLSKCQKRRDMSLQIAQAQKGKFDVTAARQILTTTNLPADRFTPAKGSTGSICMVANGRLTPHQTTGSMIAVLRKTGPITCWLTGTSLPNISLYKPFFIPGKNLYFSVFPEPSASPDDSFWWQAELLHRQILKTWKGASQLFTAEREQIQQQFFEQERDIIKQSASDAQALTEFSNKCMTVHRKKLMEWKYAIKKQRPKSGFAPFYHSYLRKINKIVGIIQ